MPMHARATIVYQNDRIQMAFSMVAWPSALSRHSALHFSSVVGCPVRLVPRLVFSMPTAAAPDPTRAALWTPGW